MIKKVGVIGSGQMGNGIAHVAALAGFDVVLNDVSLDRLKSAMARSPRTSSPRTPASRRWIGSLPPRRWMASPIATW
jgi:3-hydroxyacyl-CoA dehydrogenase